MRITLRLHNSNSRGAILNLECDDIDWYGVSIICLGKDYIVALMLPLTVCSSIINSWWGKYCMMWRSMRTICLAYSWMRTYHVLWCIGWYTCIYLWVVEASIYTLAWAYLTNHFHTVPIRFVSCRCDAERYENSGEAGGEVLLYHLQSSSTWYHMNKQFNYGSDIMYACTDVAICVVCVT